MSNIRSLFRIVIFILIFLGSFNFKTSNLQRLNTKVGETVDIFWHNITILHFPYGKLKDKSRSGGSIPPYNMDTKCGKEKLGFDCFIYNDMDENLPRGVVGNFSALYASGWGNTRIKPLYKESSTVGKSRILRPETQIWISNQMESSMSPNNARGLQGLEGDFNWTASNGRGVTFRLNDVFVQNLEQPIPLAIIEENVNNVFKHKDKLVCWVMSNCHNIWTNRINLAEALAKNLPEKLHFWGKSGRCLSRAKNHVIYHGAIKGDKTLQSEVKNCWFYLAFENSNCTDYITEKFLNSLVSYAIPIVNGWKESYKRLLPGSFIHAKDFPDVGALSKYLVNLQKNISSILEFQKWRQFVEVGGAVEERNRVLCEICRKLKAEKESNFSNQYIIPDLVKVYENKQTCVVDH